MKRIFSLGFLVFAILTATAQKQVINDANAEPRTLSGSFNAIRVSDAIDIYIVQGETESIAVSAATVEYRNKIKTTIEGGVLRIWFDADNKWLRNGNNRKLKAYISFKNLAKLTASGASDVYVESDIRSNELELHLSGASDFKGGNIFANQMVVDISGASDARVKGGKVTTLKVEASGASDFYGFDLETENCSAVASGASDIKVTVNNELNVHATGASGVQYRGNGRIQNLKTSGASGVHRKG